MFKTIIIVIIATVVCIVAFAVVDKVTTDIRNPDNTLNIGTNEATDSINVTIEGEVKYEGTYVLPRNSTMSTLIEAGGGVNQNADERCYDLTYVLTGGMTYYIAPIYDNSNACQLSPLEKVNINSADKASLMSVSAIGDTTAGNIISYRNSNGKFGCLEEIMNVTGIGQATFQKVKNYITIRG